MSVIVVWNRDVQSVDAATIEAARESIVESAGGRSYTALKIDRIAQEHQWLQGVDQGTRARFCFTQLEFLASRDRLQAAIRSKDQALITKRIGECHDKINGLRRLFKSSEVASFSAFTVLNALYMGGEEEAAYDWARQELEFQSSRDDRDVREELTLRRIMIWTKARQGQWKEAFSEVEALPESPVEKDFDYDFLLFESRIPIIKMCQDHGDRKLVVAGWSLVGKWQESHPKDERPTPMVQDLALDWKFGSGHWREVLEAAKHVRPSYIPDKFRARAIVDRGKLLCAAKDRESAEEELRTAWGYVTNDDPTSPLRSLIIGKGYFENLLHSDQLPIADAVLQQLDQTLREASINDGKHWSMWLQLAGLELKARNYQTKVRVLDDASLKSQFTRFLGGGSEFERDANVAFARRAIHVQDFAEAQRLLTKAEQWDRESWRAGFHESTIARLRLQLQVATALKDIDAIRQLEAQLATATSEVEAQLRQCEELLQPHRVTRRFGPSRYGD